LRRLRGTCGRRSRCSSEFPGERERRESPRSVVRRRPTSNRGLKSSDDVYRILDFDHETPIVLVVEVDDNRTLGIVYVEEDRSVRLIKRAGCDDAGQRRARQAQAVPPTTRRFRVDASTADVRQRNLELALERPHLVPAFDFEAD